MFDFGLLYNAEAGGGRKLFKEGVTLEISATDI